jgi:hypothetical protein
MTVGEGKNYDFVDVILESHLQFGGFVFVYFLLIDWLINKSIQIHNKFECIVQMLVFIAVLLDFMVVREVYPYRKRFSSIEGKVYFIYICRWG